MNDVLVWAGFILLVTFLLVLDLFVFNRRNHEIHFREAMVLSLFWIAVAFIFNLFIYFWKGRQSALEFLTGYLIEESLSVDNLFVFIMLFSYFRVEKQYQHKILFWGILGAVVMRLVFIVAGVALIQRFHWVIYVFGAFLIFTGIRMVGGGEGNVDPEKNLLLRLARRFFPLSNHHDNGKFFLKEQGRWLATPLFIVLLVVETTDVMFAVDSIPAILAISTDPFIVFTSNVFAILGLRALYFALSGIVQMFHYLKYGLGLVLAFVGIKMLLSHLYPIPVQAALLVVGGILGTSIFISVLRPAKKSHS
jgi:tellurite resistance protein TerC